MECLCGFYSNNKSSRIVQYIGNGLINSEKITVACFGFFYFVLTRSNLERGMLERNIITLKIKILLMKQEHLERRSMIVNN